MSGIEDLIAMVRRQGKRLIASYMGDPDHSANRSLGQKNRKRRAISVAEKNVMARRWRSDEDSQSIADDYKITVETLRNTMSRMRVRRPRK